MPLACPLLKTWLLPQCSSLIFLSHHSATIETGWRLCCTARARWLSFQAVSLCSVTRDIRSREDSAYLALFPLNCNPELINKSPFPRAPVALGTSWFISESRTWGCVHEGLSQQSCRVFQSCRLVPKDTNYRFLSGRKIIPDLTVACTSGIAPHWSRLAPLTGQNYIA